MITARSYFTRMNEGRRDTDWLTDDQLLKGTEKFFKLNNYSTIEYNKVLAQEAGTSFLSPIIASRRANHDKEAEIQETVVSIFKSNINKFEINFIGFVESFTFNILDNYESTNPMLVTDSLSYFHMIKDQEINVAIEDMMRDGLFILFLNHRFAYAFFDRFENMTQPIPAYE